MYVELKADGQAIYSHHLDQNGGTTITNYYTNWSIVRRSGRYFYSESGGNWFSHWRAGALPLEYPLIQLVFIYDANTNYIFVK